MCEDKKLKGQKRELPSTLETNFITSSFPLNCDRIILILEYRPGSAEMCHSFRQQDLSGVRSPLSAISLVSLVQALSPKPSGHL